MSNTGSETTLNEMNINALAFTPKKRQQRKEPQLRPGSFFEPKSGHFSMDFKPFVPKEHATQKVVETLNLNPESTSFTPLKKKNENERSLLEKEKEESKKEGIILWALDYLYHVKQVFFFFSSFLLFFFFFFFLFPINLLS